MFLASPLTSFRQWLKKPKRDDRQPLVSFFYADEALNTVVTCLDAWAGQGPCEALIDRLRICQQEVLAATERVIDAISMRDQLCSRDFRLKFPDDVQEELGTYYAPLWFGAECLAAGSNIANKEEQSEQLRPCAKKLVRQIELMREAVRRQAIDAPHCYTSDVVQAIVEFDKLWTEFEAGYVACWVPVKSVDEVEQQHNVIAMFSEAVLRAMKKQNITNEMMESCDPALMLVIPRLSLIWGLRITQALSTEEEFCPYLFQSYISALQALKTKLRLLTDTDVESLEKQICASLHSGNDDTNSVSRLKASLENEHEYTAVEKHVVIVPSLSLRSTSSGEAIAVPDTRPLEQVAAENCICKGHEEFCTQPGCLNRTGAGRKRSKDSDKDPSLVEDYFGTLDSEPRLEIARVLTNTVARNHGHQPPVAHHERSGIDCLPIEGDEALPTVYDGLPEAEEECGPIQTAAPNECAIPQESLPTEQEAYSSLLNNVSLASAGNNQSENTGDDVTCALEKMPGQPIESSELRQNESTPIRSPPIESAQLTTNNQVVEASLSDTADLSSSNLNTIASEEVLHSLFVEIAAIADQLQSGPHAKDMRYMLKLIFEMYSFDDDDADDANHQSSPYLSQQSGPLSPSQSSGRVSPSGEQNNGLWASIYEDESEFSDSCTGGGGVTNSNASREPVLLKRPAWKSDVEAPACGRCGVAFTVVRRRHHCRSCGDVFCGSCANQFASLPRLGYEKPVRLCVHCHATSKSVR